MAVTDFLKSRVEPSNLPRKLGVNDKGMAEAIPLSELQFSLQSLNVLCLPALGAFGDIELNALAFLQCAEAV
jgi:hypothetical protein